MLKKLLKKLSALDFHKTADVLDDLIEQEEAEMRQQAPQQPQMKTPFSQQPQTNLRQEAPQSLSPDVIQAVQTWVARNILNNQGDAPLEPLPDAWRQNIAVLGQIGDVIDAARTSRTGVYVPPWTDDFLATAIVGESAEPTQPSQPEPDPSGGIYLSPEENALIGKFMDTHGQWFKSLSPEVQSAWMQNILMPRGEGKRGKDLLDNRVNAMLKNETTLQGFMTYPALADKLRAALAQHNMPIDMLSSVAAGSGRDKAMFQEYIKSVIAGPPGAQDSIFDVLLDLSSGEHEDPARAAAKAEIWKFWQGAANPTKNKQIMEDRQRDLSLQHGVGEDSSVGDLVDTESLEQDRRDIRTSLGDEGEELTEQAEAAAQIRGLTSDKLDVLRNVSEAVFTTYEDYMDWQGDAAKPLTRSIPAGGKTYDVRVTELMGAYLDAATSQIENILQPENKVELKSFIDDYNKTAPDGAQIQMENEEETEARRQIEDEYRQRARYRGQGRGHIDVALVPTQEGVDIDFDLSRMVSSKSLLPFLDARAQVVEYLKNEEGARAQVAGPEVAAERARNHFRQQGNLPEFYIKNIDSGFVESAMNTTDDELELFKMLSAKDSQGGFMADTKSPEHDKSLGNALRNLRTKPAESWPKMFPFVFDAIQGFPVETRRMFFDLFGVHGGMKEPLNESRHNQLVEKLGPQWYEHDSDTLVDVMLSDMDPNEQSSWAQSAHTDYMDGFVGQLTGLNLKAARSKYETPEELEAAINGGDVLRRRGGVTAKAAKDANKTMRAAYNANPKAVMSVMPDYDGSSIISAGEAMPYEQAKTYQSALAAAMPPSDNVEFWAEKQVKDARTKALSNLLGGKIKPSHFQRLYEEGYGRPVPERQQEWLKMRENLGRRSGKPEESSPGYNLRQRPAWPRVQQKYPQGYDPTVAESTYALSKQAFRRNQLRIARMIRMKKHLNKHASSKGLDLAIRSAVSVAVSDMLQIG